MMKLSVALATFNGDRYISEQLGSIRAQTRPPNELVVVDDASTEGTLAIVERFAKTAPFPVRILRNDSNRGSTPTFARAISACSGGIIVLADQDDAWRENKLQTLADALEREPGAAFAFSDAEVVDANLKPSGHRLWDAIRFDESEQRRFNSGGGFECLLRRHRVTGATMAFRSSFRDRILPIPHGWVHDAWIAVILSATAGCVAIDEPLIGYRQHANQQHGGLKRALHTDYLRANSLTAAACEAVADRFEEALVRLQKYDDVPFQRLNLLRDKIEHHRRRAELRRSGWRWPRVLRQALCGGYARFDQGWKTIAQDVFLGR